ncbi:hypothetical protein SLS57_009022 [Botryosphaeria dothidea]
MAPSSSSQSANNGFDLSFPLLGLRARSTNVTQSSGGSPAADLVEQLGNPTDILSVLLIIGGDIVQKAMAQVSGSGPAPVCFSFGWVSYSFISLVNLLGDGRLMPAPDYPCKVINLENGYYRDNKSWLIGRLMRDNESFMTKKLKSKNKLGRALRVAIYEPSSHVPMNLIRPIHVVVTVLQFGIAAIPWALYGDWGAFMVTSLGTALTTAMGWLPQWKAEKFPAAKVSNKTIAITSGNGSKDIMIVRSLGKGIDLEHLAAAESPRATRSWEQWGFFIGPQERETHVKTLNGLPLDFWLTRAVCTLFSLGSLILLILAAGIQSNSWYLLIVGAAGMFQNAFVAGLSIHPEGQAIPLLCREVIYGNKVMDVLMDLEVKLEQDEIAGDKSKFDIVKPLVKEFFPGELRDNEKRWWKGQRKDYDEKRMDQKDWRGIPRSRWDLKNLRPMSSPSPVPEEEEKKSSPNDLSDETQRGTPKPAPERHSDRLIPEGTIEDPGEEDRIQQISTGWI